MKTLLLILLTVLLPDSDYMLRNVATGQYLRTDGSLTQNADSAANWRLVSWNDTISGDVNTYIYSDSTVLALRNGGIGGWQTVFTADGNTTNLLQNADGSYKLSYQYGWDTRYLNIVDDESHISAAKTASTRNDWLFLPAAHPVHHSYRILEFSRTSSYSCYSLAYESHNVQGETCWLSGWVKFPTDGEGGQCTADHQFLSCHATITSNSEAPSVMGPYDAITSSVMTNMPLWMEPDYLGFGKSLGEAQPYIAPDIMAETCVDFLLAVYDMLRDMHGLDMYTAQLPTYGAGYSQGGAVILAIQRYVENSPDLTDAQRAAIHYVSTCCGAGPYCPLATISQYLYDDAMTMPVAAPLLVDGMVAAYPEIFGTYTAADYFSDAFNAANILENMRSGSYNIEALNTQIANACGATMDAMLSDSAKCFNSDLCQRLLWALGASDLTRDWVPQARIWMYHSSQDDVVPYLNSVLAHQRFLDMGVPSDSITFETPSLGVNHTVGAVNFNYLMITGGYKR